MKTIIKFSFLAFALSTTHSSYATSENITAVNLQSPEKTLQYWTAERLANAKEMPHPQFDPNGVKEIDKDALNSEEPQHHEGMLPVKNIGADLRVRVPKNLIPLKQKPQSQGFFDRGTSGFYFTSSRLNPIAADLLYPYSAIGRLFFTVPGGGNFSCSAATINQRIIVTAGNCVHSGSNGNAGYFTNFLFIPSYRNGVAPYQMWPGVFAITTDTWATGGGLVPNAADYAMIEVSDLLINSTLTRLGNLTGAMGWLTNAVMPNHVHLIGYPCNFDSCQQMHQVMAQTARTVAPNNAESGSDMGPGANGSPWIQNFGPTSVGQSGAFSPYRNVIVGVTSYRYGDPQIMLEGTSILDSRFVTLYNTICAHNPGNCI